MGSLHAAEVHQCRKMRRNRRHQRKLPQIGADQFKDPALSIGERAPFRNEQFNEPTQQP